VISEIVFKGNLDDAKSSQILRRGDSYCKVSIVNIKECFANFYVVTYITIFEPRHDKTNIMRLPSMDPDQPVHPRSLIRIHAVRPQTL
jgi:hypothetical protein